MKKKIKKKLKINFLIINSMTKHKKLLKIKDKRKNGSSWIPFTVQNSVEFVNLKAFSIAEVFRGCLPSCQKLIAKSIEFEAFTQNGGSVRVLGYLAP